jgi:hypothetical protein
MTETTTAPMPAVAMNRALLAIPKSRLRQRACAADAEESAGEGAAEEAVAGAPSARETSAASGKL